MYTLFVERILNATFVIFQLNREYSNLIENNRTPKGFFFSNLITNRREISKIFQLNHEQSVKNMNYGARKIFQLNREQVTQNFQLNHEQEYPTYMTGYMNK